MAEEIRDRKISDQEIIDLYWAREEQAITETDNKYGELCRRVSVNLLGSREDAEECVNDTWLTAWNSMPDERPRALRAWLLRVVRNISIDRYRRDHSGKRHAETEVLLSELEDCIPSGKNVETELERKEIGEVIDSWLRTLNPFDRRAFLLRYFEGAALQSIAEEYGLNAGRLAKRMYRLRLQLREVFEQEGIFI